MRSGSRWMWSGALATALMIGGACQEQAPEAAFSPDAVAVEAAPAQEAASPEEWAEAPDEIVPGQSKKKGESAKREDIRKLLVLTGSGKLGVQTMNMMIQTFKRTNPEVPQKFWDEFAREVKEDELVDLVIPIYDKHYTHDEIKQLIEFYESPVGQKSIRVMPQIVQESQAAGQRWGRELALKVQKRLQEEGHLDGKP